MYGVFIFNIATLTSSHLLDPMLTFGNAGVDSRLAVARSMAEVDDAVLKPAVTLFTDQRTTGVAVARGSNVICVTGAHHVLRQFSIVHLAACGQVDDGHHGLSQDAASSLIYAHKHLILERDK